MRYKILFIFLVVIGSSTMGFGQEPTCPSVSVKGLDGIHQNGAAMLFSAVISADASKDLLKYEWSVINGEINEGQGTAHLTVYSNLTTGTNGLVTASVKIIGLPAKCNNTASYSSTVFRAVHHSPVTRYQDVDWKDERVTLDGVLIALWNNPAFRVFIKISYPDNQRRSQVTKRIAKIKKHVRWRDKTFNLNRLVFALEKSDRIETSIWLFYDDDEMTFCKECEIIK